jgi:hypothetical protein
MTAEIKMMVTMMMIAVTVIIITMSMMVTLTLWHITPQHTPLLPPTLHLPLQSLPREFSRKDDGGEEIQHR